MIFVINFAAENKKIAVHKNFLLAIGILCVISLAILKPAKVVCVVEENEAEPAQMEFCIVKYEHHAAILNESTTVSFSARIANASGKQKIKTFERLLKNKFSIRKNYCIEFFVEHYIFFVKSSSHYISNLAELRRLNI